MHYSFYFITQIACKSFVHVYTLGRETLQPSFLTFRLISTSPFRAGEIHVSNLLLMHYSFHFITWIACKSFVHVCTLGEKTLQPFLPPVSLHSEITLSGWRNTWVWFACYALFLPFYNLNRRQIVCTRLYTRSGNLSTPPSFLFTSLRDYPSRLEKYLSLICF